MNQFNRIVTISAVLLMMLAAWIDTGGAMPMPQAGLHALVICSDGEPREIWLDASGLEQPAPDECLDCPDCDLPQFAAPADPVPRPALGEWLKQERRRVVSQANSVVHRLAFLSRGPPSARNVPA